MKHKILWGIFYLASLALVASVASFMGRNFLGIGPVPIRSAFANRLPSTPEGNKRRFEFFYATNRENSEETFEEQGHRLGKEISYGIFSTLISQDMIIKPFTWLDKERMKLSGRAEMTRSTFKDQLKEAVQNSPHKSLLVIVWGYRDWFRSAAQKTAYTAYVLDINTPVLMFDWPGNQGDSRNGYLASQGIATQSGPDLGRVLEEVIRETGAENLWLMGSSLGCQTICDAFAWMSTQPDLKQDKPKISHVVLSAPDVAAQAFNDQFGQNIKTFSEHLTAYVSSNDRALLMSQWVNRARRLGRTAEISLPPTQRNSEYQFEEGLELLNLQAKEDYHIEVVDATPVNRLRNLHHFFTDSAEFFDDLYQRLLEPDHIVSRRLYPVKQQGETIWILWNM